ncbi:DNA primase [Granulibacter bethesdensis]|uniref:DNA primase n=1 Tax=Granulibacter bethesdensis TaxID=364410 RepID=UPI00090B53BC|nr:DNA primase [Granulibacter bethesdensis]APH58123.1 DNA primase [Granulibacter bethesdensis]
MALSPDFLDELRARTPIASVIGRRVRLSKAGRNWKGCCPFHGEKTPSFYVYDDHFHCFGCGVHGDVVSFVMQSQGAGFLEAVEQLAAEAGLDIPKPSREETRQAEARAGVHEVLAQAGDYYAMLLSQPEGQRGLTYLLDRGLSEATIRRFGLGWAPARGSLATAMAGKGITPEQLAEAGLLRLDEDGPGRRPWDQFHERVMFPIRDRRGRIISFGGRILGDGQPKYVNGPETAVFSKRRSLYALDLAREAVRGGAALLAVEGYMDVIALHQVGFSGAVAPLGTALTEEQLDALWQLSPAPILCFDGDAAGARAALRVAELALPFLTTERTLHVARLPAGEDPDSLIRARGSDTFSAVLEDARRRSFADALFAMLREGQALETPEQRAVFQRRLNDAAARIADKTLAAEYRSALREKFYALRRPATGARRGGHYGGGSRGGGWQFTQPAPNRLDPALAAEMAGIERLRILTAILLSHPALLHDVEEAFATLDLPDWLDRLRRAILTIPDHTDPLDSEGLIDHLQRAGLGREVERVFAPHPFPLPNCAVCGGAVMPAEAEAAWWHIFGFLHRDRLDQEVMAAQRAWDEHGDEQSQRRLTALVQARDKIRRGESDDPEA